MFISIAIYIKLHNKYEKMCILILKLYFIQITFLKKKVIITVFQFSSYFKHFSNKISNLWIIKYLIYKIRYINIKYNSS